MSALRLADAARGAGMRRAKHQPLCEECGDEPAAIDWKDDPRDSETWCYTECQRCDAYLCKSCASDGSGVCVTCLSASRTAEAAR